MRKKIVFCLMMACAGFCYSQAGHLFFKGFGRLMETNLGEELYTSHKLVSDLQWKSGSLALCGGAIGYERDGWFVEGSFCFGKGTGKGQMIDSDFLSDGTNDRISFHPVETSQVQNASLKFSMTSLEFGRLKILTQIEADYKHSCHTASNGWGWYSKGSGPWYGPESTYYQKSRLYDIDYEKYSFELFTGFGVSYDATSRLILGASALVCPYSYYYCLDTHHSKNYNTVYNSIQKDSMSQFKFGINAVYKITDNTEVYFDIARTCGFEKSGVEKLESESGQFMKIISSKSGTTDDMLCGTMGIKFKIRDRQ